MKMMRSREKEGKDIRQEQRGKRILIACSNHSIILTVGAPVGSMVGA